MGFALSFREYADLSPHALLTGFIEDLQHPIKDQLLPIITPSAEDLSFATYGVAAADDWVLSGSLVMKRRRPLLINWRVLLGLTSHGLPYVSELIERGHRKIAALVWRMAEEALRRYNPTTFELFERCVQNSYVTSMDPRREVPELRSWPMRAEEVPVMTHYYNQQLSDAEFISAVKKKFDTTYAALLVPTANLPSINSKVALPEHISGAYIDLLLGYKYEIPKTYPQTDYPTPPFGPLRPGMYLYELLYAYSFRYRPGGATVLSEPVLNGEKLPSALVIDFNKFIRYREGNMAFYSKIAGKKATNLYDIAVAAAEVMRAHYYGSLQGQHIEKYYAYLHQEDATITSGTLATYFVIPTALVRKFKDAACKYGVNHLALDPALPRRKRATGAEPYRRAVSGKSVLSVNAPPELCRREGDLLGIDSPTEFRFTHRYREVLISPPWSLTMEDVAAYYRENKIVRVAQHLGRVYVPYDILRRLPCTLAYWSEELDAWLRGYATMSKYSLAAEIKMRSKHGVNPIVRADYGASHMRFRPEEDDAIVRLYRPSMTQEQREEMSRVCFGRSISSIAHRAVELRNGLIAQGVLDLDKLPHARRGEPLLARLREAKRKALRDEERKRREAEQGAEVV